MAGGLGVGGIGGGQQPQQQMQFGPESLIALLMSLMQGGPAQMGPGAGNGQIVGQGSLQSILPQLMAAMQPPPQLGSGGAPGAPQPAPGSGGAPRMAPGGGGGTAIGAPMQPGGIGGLLQLLSRLGMGGGPGTGVTSGLHAPNAL